jgi:hypothetical protein
MTQEQESAHASDDRETLLAEISALDENSNQPEQGTDENIDLTQESPLLATQLVRAEIIEVLGCGELRLGSVHRPRMLARQCGK